MMRRSVTRCYGRTSPLSAAAAHVANPIPRLSTQHKLNFDDAQNAFASKSTSELIRASLLFKVCRIRPLVEHSGALINTSYKLLGSRLTDNLLKQTFFGHFCGGESVADIKPTVSSLSDSGIGAILDYAAEADVKSPRDLGVPQHKVHARTYDYDGEAACDANAEIALAGIANAAEATVAEKGFSAVKVTAMGQPELLSRMSSILLDARRLFKSLDGPNLSKAKSSYFNHAVDYPSLKAGIFNSGVSLEESEIRKLFDEMDVEKDGKIDYLDWISFLNPVDLTMGPLTQFFNVDPLSQTEQNQLANMIRRLDNLAKFAAEKNVRLMVDAEQTYMQPAIDHLVLNLQRRYNKSDGAVIFNTFQCYLRDSESRIRIDLERARREGFVFACKLVRGAYMVQERKRAAEVGYRDPIHKTIEDTHRNYDAMVNLLCDHLDLTEFMVASHNEVSVANLIGKMEEGGIDPETGGIYFGQLLGMCDHVSFSLGHAGYKAYKYVPYGPVKEVIPYLVRRAEENAGLMDGVSTESQLLWKEIKRRISFFKK